MIVCDGTRRQTDWGDSSNNLCLKGASAWSNLRFAFTGVFLEYSGELIMPNNDFVYEHSAEWHHFVTKLKKSDQRFELSSGDRC